MRLCLRLQHPSLVVLLRIRDAERGVRRPADPLSEVFSLGSPAYTPQSHMRAKSNVPGKRVRRDEAPEAPPAPNASSSGILPAAGPASSPLAPCGMFQDSPIGPPDVSRATRIQTPLGMATTEPLIMILVLMTCSRGAFR